MVELRRPIRSNHLEKVSASNPVSSTPKSSRIEPRRKPVPTPNPPSTAEEWIERANADGQASRSLTKHLAVSLDGASCDLLETLAIEFSLSKIALVSKIIQDAVNQVDEILAFKRSHPEPSGPFFVRTFLLPVELFSTANSLPKLLRVFGRSRSIRLLIAFYGHKHFSDSFSE